ncbi:orotidine-5'-phosphate decarboxylase [Dyadobacter sediminis]|uniref:Orotidine-5'-phosphate decarboxylase n=1 Tax=Dyadobacter sediminis TaxID=1493691 RepID=A0A5R9KDY5_9BACT|nr:orotidine-5'-phosphate decarboxylase [Dyadobacter sediminis]TLU94344.1 orotidine-5'-phosphate decarboxylase [Dyadobacter sediminis]GGB92102.1 orotidine 5'-phosphate decarboxylase [Dyadobacter sediminis]
MTYEALFESICRKKSYLCVGLDTDIRKIPAHLLKEKDPVFEFNRQIIDATADFCVSYKPNTAFYEALGPKGWESLQKTVEYIPKTHFTIADAKRGDIGNTSGLYARTFFDPASSGMDFDAVTVAPYMGSDSVKPFLEFENKWVILLALTSNSGSNDFQRLDSEGASLYEHVLRTSQTWAGPDRMMYVLGATQASEFQKIRTVIPEHFMLVPGVGAQGGSLEEVSKYGMNAHCGLLVNASRSIIYAGNDKDFALKAKEEASGMQQEMEIYLDRYCK